MNSRSQRRTFAILFGLLALTVLTPVGIWWRTRSLAAERESAAQAVRAAVIPATGRAVDRRLAVVPSSLPTRDGTASAAGATQNLSPLGMRIAELLRGLDPATVRPGELVVVFDGAAAYQRFLADAAAADWPVPGRIPELAAVWLVPGPAASDAVIAALARLLEPYAAEILDLGPNRMMFLAVPSRYEQAQNALNTSSLALLGLVGPAPGTVFPGGRPTVAWGRDAMIALLDTGIVPAVVAARTFPGRDAALVGLLDAGWGNEPADSHGSGAAAMLSWVAPGARILGVRVTDGAGVSDVFSVSQGLVNAMNVGASFVAVSPASPEPVFLLARAVSLAATRGVTVVASTAGDGSTWPAADPGVIAVGSLVTRRTGQADEPVATPQVMLEQGLLDPAAGAAIVAGALADVMSVYPGTKAADAWAALRYMTDEAGVERTGIAADFFASGLQVLNLGWVGMPVGDQPGGNGPFTAGNFAAAGAFRNRRTGGTGPSRVLVGPQPGGRRGPGARAGGPASGTNDNRPAQGPANDRTVRGTTVPIGQSTRGGPR